MTDTQHIKIQDYAYNLPEDRIAKYPLSQRDQSKLLLRACDGSIREEVFSALPKYLPQDALMVFNNTKVIQARLHFHKSTGALIEIFCLEPFSPLDYQQSFSSKGEVSWVCLVGNLKKWKEGALEREVQVQNHTIVLRAERVGEEGTGFEIRFSWNDTTISWAEILESIGELPIPPYLNRDTEESDLKTYQTVYSRIKGSVAAPTAGLHIERNEITLHVGAGTFKPVKSEEISGHTMHAEWIAVPRTSIERLLAHKAQCIAVGTTSVRTLESLYYIGVRLHQCRTEGRTPSDEDLHVPQWFPYEYATACSTPLTSEEALREILLYLDANNLQTLHTATQIIIAPGYEYQIVRTIVTNFHQPQSTLLLLVSAFVDGRWKEIYNYALGHHFRFLSYGDSSVLNYDALKK